MTTIVKMSGNSNDSDDVDAVDSDLHRSHCTCHFLHCLMQTASYYSLFVSEMMKSLKKDEVF